MVMVCHQKPRPVIAKDLEAFLGKDPAESFTVWYVQAYDNVYW